MVLHSLTSSRCVLAIYKGASVQEHAAIHSMCYSVFMNVQHFQCATFKDTLYVSSTTHIVSNTLEHSECAAVFKHSVSNTHLHYVLCTLFGCVDTHVCLSRFQHCFQK